VRKGVWEGGREGDLYEEKMKEGMREGGREINKYMERVKKL